MNKKGGPGRSGRGDGGGGKEAGKEGGGDGVGRKIICICMRRPALPSSPQLPWRERRREGVGRGRETCGGGGRLELRLRRTRVSGTEELVCMARADWLVAGGWV